MGSLIGHVAPGFGFVLIGLWQLFHHTRLFAINPSKYRSPPWFPTAFLRHLELYVIIAGISLFVVVEFFLEPDRHTPLDPDGSIGSNHLHNFEHVLMALTILLYPVLALAVDKLPFLRRRSSDHHSIIFLVAGMGFVQEFLLFHLHSTDHTGVEGQYHWLLQLILAVCAATTLLGIPFPASFAVGFVRSVSIIGQGLWMALLGIMLWTPGLVPKGCFLREEVGHTVMHCDGEVSLRRAKSLVNIEFGWFLILLTVFATSFYVGMMWLYADADAGVEYQAVDQKEDEDVEAQRRN